MKITFLGTGTSMGVPVAGGYGRDKIAVDPRNIRWRSSAWVQTPKSSVVIDTGPEFRLQTLRAGITQLDLVLITHEHMDHIAGLDDLRPICHRQKQPMPVYTTRAAIEAIRKRFDYMFGPDKYPSAAAIDLHEVDQAFSFRDINITPLPVEHGRVKVLGYRLNDFSYITDVKNIPEETKKRIKGSEVLVLSGLRWKPAHPTHMTIPEAVETVEELDVPQTYLIHMNSFVNHAKTNQKLPDHVQLAYDQLTVELSS